MKKLLILLFSLLFLSSPSVFADDISDFTIEGMSIGDSLLDYMTEEEILNKIEIYEGYQFLKEPYKYIEIYLNKDFSSYDNLTFFIKNNSTNQYVGNKNEKYTIFSIFGTISYIENFDNCIAKRNEIVEVVSKMFPNVQPQELNRSHRADSSGDSIFDVTAFLLDSGGTIELSCTDFEETFRIKRNWTEGLNVSINSAEIQQWTAN